MNQRYDTAAEDGGLVVSGGNVSPQQSGRPPGGIRPVNTQQLVTWLVYDAGRAFANAQPSGDVIRQQSGRSPTTAPPGGVRPVNIQQLVVWLVSEIGRAFANAQPSRAAPPGGVRPANIQQLVVWMASEIGHACANAQPSRGAFLQQFGRPPATAEPSGPESEEPSDDEGEDQNDPLASETASTIMDGWLRTVAGWNAFLVVRFLPIHPGGIIFPRLLGLPTLMDYVPSPRIETTFCLTDSFGTKDCTAITLPIA